MWTRTRFPSFLLAAALPLCACARTEGEAPAPPQESGGAPQPADPAAEQNVIAIAKDAQGSYGDIRIGVGFVGRGEYTLGADQKRTGRIAELWLFDKNDPAKNTKIKVYIGQRVEFGKYAFVVDDIRGGKGLVRLKFETAP